MAEGLLGQPALGLGDAMLAAMALAVVSGALVGSTARLSGRLGPREPFPFRPFIALLVDRSAVVVEHLVDVVGRLMNQLYSRAGF